MVTKVKTTVKEMTGGQFFSLQDAETALGVAKPLLWRLIQDSGITVQLLFNKYTVLTAVQLNGLKKLAN